MDTDEIVAFSMYDFKGHELLANDEFLSFVLLYYQFTDRYKTDSEKDKMDRFNKAVYSLTHGKCRLKVLFTTDELHPIGFYFYRHIEHTECIFFSDVFLSPVVESYNLYESIFDEITNAYSLLHYDFNYVIQAHNSQEQLFKLEFFNKSKPVNDEFTYISNDNISDELLGKINNVDNNSNHENYIVEQTFFNPNEDKETRTKLKEKYDKVMNGEFAQDIDFDSFESRIH